MKKVPNFIKNIFKFHKKWVLLTLIILAALGFFLRPKTNPANQPQFTMVQKQNITTEVNASGVLEGKDSSDLKFIGGGKLAFVNVKVGEHVTQGEAIAGLDQTQLIANLQQAKNTLQSDQAAVDKIVDDIHLSQYGNGGFSNIGTANETQTQREQRITAQTARDSAVDAVKAAQDALNNSVIYSPLDGIVTDQVPLPGQNVLATDTIATIQDFSEIVFAADVDESDVGQVSLGQKANFTLNAYGDQNFTGTVTEIASETHTTSSGSTAVTVKIAIDNSSIKPIAGLNGQVNIITAQHSNVLVIPQSALRQDNTVLIKKGKNIVAQKVTTGLSNDIDIEITSGLNEGDQIVINPSVVKNVKGG